MAENFSAGAIIMSGTPAIDANVPGYSREMLNILTAEQWQSKQITSWKPGCPPPPEVPIKPNQTIKTDVHAIRRFYSKADLAASA